MRPEKDLKEEELQETVNETVNEETEKQEEETAAAGQETAPTEEDNLAETEAKLAELHDKYLRQVAEFDNYRKRTMKEKAELILNGAEKTITAFLPVLDDMERALKNMEKAEDVAAVKEGVELIFQKFIVALVFQNIIPKSGRF